MRRYQKYYGKAFFPLVWNFDHENFSSSHLVIPGKIQYLDISFLAAGPLIRYSALKIWTVSNISLGRGCLLYKRDLRKAYRQFPVDPHDYHLLGYTWGGQYYFDTVLTMGLRSAAMSCHNVLLLLPPGF